MPNSKGVRVRPVILLVDDHDDAREMYCEYLEYQGFTCLTAADGEDALQIVRERLPDLVLLEASLPGRDGWDVTKIIKGDPMLRSTWVVWLTSEVFEEHRERALHAGADAFIAKPIVPDELGRIVRRLLKARAAGQADLIQ